MPVRHLGFFTTDAELVIRSWDASLERMTGIAVDAARGRSIAEVMPDLESRGLLGVLRETLSSGATQVLAPALHHYLIPCPPAAPSAELATMQQRVVITPLRTENAVVGLAFSVEDVTARVERERQLARELRAQDPAARRAAIERLAEDAREDGLGPIELALADDDWQLRRFAVDKLADSSDTTLVHAVVGMLREWHRDFSLLSSAMKLLTMSGVDVATALIAVLEDPDPDLRIQAALALGSQRRPEAVSALIRALDDQDVNVRFHAIESLGKLGASAAVDRLSAIVATRDFFLSFPALDALVRIHDATVTPQIVPLLDDPVLAGPAAEALGALGDESAVGPLVAALESADPPVGTIVDALATIHAHYEETSGAAGQIEDLVRRLTTAGAADRILGEVRRSTGRHLRNVVTVLSWLRGEAIERALAHLLGTASVNHDAIEALVRFGRSMVDLLVEQLDREDVDTRRAAVVALGRIGDRRAVPALVRVIEAGDRELWGPAAAALGHIGDARGFGPMLALLGDGDAAIRQAAIGALHSIGHPEMANRVYELLESPDRHVRESAVRIAGYFGYANCADRLIARAGDEDEAVRAAALEHLAYLEDARVGEVLISAVAREGPRCRSAAAHALAYVNAPGARDALRAALHDADRWVRYFAAISIGRRRETALAGELTRLAESDPARQVRVAAVEAIGAMAGESSIEILTRMAAAPDVDVAITAVRALGTVGSPAGVPTLQTALRSSDPRRRIAAADAFASSGLPEAVDALRWIASGDADPLVSRAAITGLERLAIQRRDVADAAVDALITTAIDPERRAAASAALGRVPASGIPAVGAALGREDPAARLVAIDALARLARPAASAFLIQALDDSAPAVRQRAISALARLGTRGVARRFAAMARTDPSPAVRRAAELALSRAGDAHAEGRA